MINCLQVNECDVVNKTHEQVVRSVKSSGDIITLEVTTSVTSYHQVRGSEEVILQVKEYFEESY